MLQNRIQFHLPLYTKKWNIARPFLCEKIFYADITTYKREEKKYEQWIVNNTEMSRDNVHIAHPTSHLRVIPSKAELRNLRTE